MLRQIFSDSLHLGFTFSDHFCCFFSRNEWAINIAGDNLTQQSRVRLIDEEGAVRLIKRRNGVEENAMRWSVIFMGVT